MAIRSVYELRRMKRQRRYKRQDIILSIIGLAAFLAILVLAAEQVGNVIWGRV